MSQSLPARQESGQFLRRYGLNLAAQGSERPAPDSPEDLSVAPLTPPVPALGCGRAVDPKVAEHNPARRPHPLEDACRDRCPQAKPRGNILGQEGPVRSFIDGAATT